MRNGDYVPTRCEAQNDAVSMIFSSKTNSNPENTVGLMTLSGKSGPEVLVTLTRDIGKVLTALHNVLLKGSPAISVGIQIASLALKHRQNKNQKQRIIVFIGSPIQETEEDLVKIGKKLKKNNVSVDVVNFGEDSVNQGKLLAFIDSVNSGDGSHLVTVPAGPLVLSDVLISSPIFAGDGGSSGGNNFEFGVDPNLDPELALALRISLEEERARQEQATSADPDSSNIAQQESNQQSDRMDTDAMDEEDEEIARAIQMSLEKPSDEKVFLFFNHRNRTLLASFHLI
jgi:26S proteasome regulatory subunit N10